ncbi:2-phosphosulfolactate phosphatase [Thermus caliditerrae]|uniref:2-phosphosulfolactate phosphatase n=1 Tax=Thermus caliditerrae TaxID=1330700 RepID=UPI000571037F|nr:2-phosphosulfolactate phosphatase [Thermus caliditerrae]
MRFRVDPLPLPGTYRGTAIVVDVIRATTTAALYLKAGATALVLARGAEAARALRQDGEILAGEVGGLPPEGFDLGNSPREVDGVVGKVVVMATTNGTRAVHAAMGARWILLGSLQNARAVAERAVATGEEVHLVCAGKEGQVALDDLYAAGVIGRHLQALGFFPEGEMAHLALCLAVNPPLPVLSVSEAAQALVRVGLGEDVAECARVDVHGVVPRFLGMRGEGMVFGG